MRLRAFILTCISIALLVAPACGDGREVSGDDLAEIALTQEELGESYTGVTIAEDQSGPVTNEDLLGALGEGLESQERITGYRRSFQGGVDIRIELSLHESDDGASKALASRADIILSNRMRGAGVFEFDVRAIGDEARGIDESSEPPGSVSTHVLFRSGEIFAWVSIEHSEFPPDAVQGDFRRDAVRLAEKLIEKIDTALAT